MKQPWIIGLCGLLLLTWIAFTNHPVSHAQSQPKDLARAIADAISIASQEQPGIIVDLKRTDDGGPALIPELDVERITVVVQGVLDKQ